ncbi:hypothetical protein RhiirB3_523149 [Rhizophagus irregularis]|nr:hypothetical protein RhiirB3_523149 [Rhizophagus irregularis]
MDYVAKHLNGKVIINNERFLLSNQDLINIRNSMTKEVWGLDKRKAEEINIDEFFGSNSKDSELIEATIYYKPRKELNDRSRDLAWKFGHQQILYLDGTFAAGGAQRASSSYNHLILKELILHYKDKLEQERGCEFVPKQSYGRIIAANLLQVPLEKIPTTNNHLESFNSELKVCQLKKYQNNGHLLRFDILSVILIKNITPNILLKRNLKHELQIQLKERYKSYVPFLPEERIQLENHYRQLVYYTPDPNRDEAAKWICKEKKNNSKESLHNSEPTLTPPNDPEKTILPINSSLNHHAAIWKQEHITLATNLLANLNEIDFITKSINRLSDNIPDGIEENAKCLNIEMKSILEKNE